MRIISRAKLTKFWKSNPQYLDAKEPLDAWFYFARKATWKTPADVKADLTTASILKSSRVVFNIAGNKYRLVVHIKYPAGIIFVRFVGTHKDYDEIDAETI